MKCGNEVTIVQKTFQGKVSESKRNADGTAHSLNIGGKWYCVTSKEHIEYAKAHGGPSGFVQPNGKIVSPTNEIPKEVPIQQPKTPYKYLTLTPEKIELVQEEARITYEIYLAVKAEIIEEQNGPVLGMIFNQVCENLRRSKERKDKE